MSPLTLEIIRIIPANACQTSSRNNSIGKHLVPPLLQIPSGHFSPIDVIFRPDGGKPNTRLLPLF